MRSQCVPGLFFFSLGLGYSSGIHITLVFQLLVLLTDGTALTFFSLGTDATHAEHIETIKSRNYVGVQSDGGFVPGELGMGLVEGMYCRMQCVLGA